MHRRFLSPLLTAALLLGAPALAADPPHPGEAGGHPPAAAGKEAEDSAALFALLPADSTTQHTVQLGTRRLAYSATAGTLTLRDAKGEPSAMVFYVAYAETGTTGAPRPVSFFFNGGPGAASAYLHLGAAGPEVLDFPAGDEADGAGARLEENPDTWLPFTDMVFIDAVGTGWSRPAKPAEAQKAFWGVKQDAQAFAKLVALWLARNGRSTSPKYLVGESYGGIRAIKVARELQEEQGVILNGIVMVSPAIESDFLFDTRDNPLADALRLPSLAAAALARRNAFAHGPVEDAYDYAVGPYLTAIVGPPLEGDAAKAFYTKIAEMTGVPEPVVERQRGRLDPESHDVRSQDGRLYSLYDASLGIADPFPAGDGREADPVLDGYTRAYGNAFVGYAAGDLGFKTELTYKLLAGDVSAAWDWRSDGPGLAGGMEDLARLLALDPSLKVLVAGGWFDLVCPVETNRWLIEHLPVGRDRVTLKIYPGGHMLYTRPASRAALRADVAGLYPAER